jgi:hypothetical protein
MSSQTSRSFHPGHGLCTAPKKLAARIALAAKTTSALNYEYLASSEVSMRSRTPTRGMEFSFARRSIINLSTPADMHAALTPAGSLLGQYPKWQLTTRSKRSLPRQRRLDYSGGKELQFLPGTRVPLGHGAITGIVRGSPPSSMLFRLPDIRKFTSINGHDEYRTPEICYGAKSARFQTRGRPLRRKRRPILSMHSRSRVSCRRSPGGRA